MPLGTVTDEKQHLYNCNLAKYTRYKSKEKDQYTKSPTSNYSVHCGAAPMVFKIAMRHNLLWFNWQDRDREFHTSSMEKPMDNAATSGIRSPGIGQLPSRKTTDSGDLNTLNSLAKTPAIKRKDLKWWFLLIVLSTLGWNGRSLCLCTHRHFKIENKHTWKKWFKPRSLPAMLLPCSQRV